VTRSRMRPARERAAARAADQDHVDFVLRLIDALDLDEVQEAIARALAGRLRPAPQPARRPSPPGRGQSRTPTRKGAP
jgi:hypothetical protein